MNTSVTTQLFGLHLGETPVETVALTIVKSDVARRDPFNGHENSRVSGQLQAARPEVRKWWVQSITT